MKKLLLFLLTSSIILSSGISVFASDAVFKDVKNTHWAYEYIKGGVEMGYFSGYEDNTFKPEANVTRAEAIKILTEFLGRATKKPANSKFSDVDVNSWYAPYVNVSEYMFPQKWTDENLFKSSSPVTREEVAYIVLTAMQYDYKKEKADLSLLKTFSDKEKIGFGLENYMALAVEFDVMSGYDDNTIRPDKTITRAEFATIMSRVSEQKKILDERREKVVAYMDRDRNLLWTVDEDLTYVLDSSGLPPEQVKGKTTLTYKKGRIYQGVAYSYAAGDIGSFLDYSVGQDENGVHTISGLTWQDLSSGGGSNTRTARIGNDCGASIELAYGSIGHKESISGVVKLSPMHGYPRVGQYKAPDQYNYNTVSSNKENGADVMYNSYSQLQKGDMIVKYNGSSAHSKMVIDVNVVYDENGKIDPVNSSITTHEQAKFTVSGEVKKYNEKLGCDVYWVGGTYPYTFENMFKDSYQPVTAEILIDPKPIQEVAVTDSIKEYSLDNLFTGTIQSTWMIADATIEIKDSNENTVQKSSILPTRNPEVYSNSSFKISMSKFNTLTGGLIKGKIEPEKLSSGDYTCTVTIRLVSGETFTVRDFDFTI